MRWQDLIKELAHGEGLVLTSGFRTVEEERALGGPPDSYHCRGTVAYPGALDFAGEEAKLNWLYQQIAQGWQGHIHELFLQLSHTFLAIKDNKRIAHNPEVHHRPHLHVALSDEPIADEQPVAGRDTREPPELGTPRDERVPEPGAQPRHRRGTR